MRCPVIKQGWIKRERTVNYDEENDVTTDSNGDEVPDYIDSEAYKAYAECVGGEYDTVGGFEDSYAGQFDSDETFAENLADELGLIDANASWPNTCIDWERAAREIMFDYYESHGYYFRSL